MRNESHINASELEIAFDAFKLLALKGEVDRYELFREDIVALPELGIEGRNDVLFCRVILVNGEMWHTPIFPDDDNDDIEQ